MENLLPFISNGLYISIEYLLLKNINSKTISIILS